MQNECVVYRCASQAEMYLYVRAGLPADQLPEALRKRTGALTQVMTLQLTPERKLARVDAAKVRERLAAEGYYLQLPPDGRVQAHLYFGD